MIERPELLHLLAERLGLADRPREAVEDEAVGGLGPLDALADHPDDHLVGHEPALVHVLLGGLAELGALLDGGPEDVAGRVVGQPEVLLEALPLGALAGAGRAEQDQIQL